MDRQPVQTYVLEHDWGVLSDAMRRELERGGQVYYLHNRVETITRTAARIKEMLGEDVDVAVAHGKMSQEELNDVMTRMSDGEVDVLVCTTIIETGIDIANANTLIIEDADHMGLAQLHQIRGRVGRSTRRAYAYLTYRRGKVLTEVASKRLGAIREFAEFGSGFKIAMRDLEIRGAGNVLGRSRAASCSAWATTCTSSCWRRRYWRSGARSRSAPPSAPPISVWPPPSQTAMCPRRSSGWTSTAASPPSAPRRTPTT